VQVISPNGEDLYAIRLPTQSPTCPAFVGPNLDELVITTHAVDDELRQAVVKAGRSVEGIAKDWPHRDGRLYKIRLDGVKGLAMHQVHL
jgi:sugar lactone lactonase YvrE